MASHERAAGALCRCRMSVPARYWHDSQQVLRRQRAETGAPPMRTGFGLRLTERDLSLEPDGEVSIDVL